MTQFPELLESYLLSKRKLDDTLPIFIEVLDWLDSEDDNYSLTITKLTKLCSHMLQHFRIKEKVENHINYISTDILSIIYDRGSKNIKFPQSCYCCVDNPFENENGYELESEFWKLLFEFSMEVAQKCSPKEGYVTFIEAILGSITLPIFSDKTDLSSKNRKITAKHEEINSGLLSEGKKSIPRFFRYLGLHCSLVCISRMKRNKAQFITTVCSLVLRKFVYDIECDSLYSCNCHSQNVTVSRYCTTEKMFFLQYLMNNIMKLLLDCMEESKCDAEYNCHEIGIFNSESSDGNINVTQHTIYSFLMKILENLIVIDIHDIQVSGDFEIFVSERTASTFLSNSSNSNPLHSIINIVSSNTLNQDIQIVNNNNKIWSEIIYKLCYYISRISPYTVVDTLNNIPICITDVETQTGDLDVTSLTIACYAYALFSILEIMYPIEVNYIYPKSIISLTLKLNIIYRAITIFLIYSDVNKIGYEVDCTILGFHDPLLSYFNSFKPKKISNDFELSMIYYKLINARLQEKAYFILENSVQDMLICKRTVPNLFSTIYGLSWHQNILIKQIMYSLTRCEPKQMLSNFSSIANSKSRTCINLYSNIFEKFTTLLNDCYPYSVIFNIYFNLIESQKKLFFKKIINSTQVIVGVLNNIRAILWRDICNQDINRISMHKADLGKIITFSSSFLSEFKNLDYGSSQSDKVTLVVLNLLKLILLSYKKKQTKYLKDIVSYLYEEPSIIKKYISHVESVILEIHGQNDQTYDLIKFVIKDIEEIL
ncbi:hypothetical protein OIY81_1307 [Cryptosporidium canis]|uniref:Uncharacterized protein n=1 Tax=Cryptosporidium canis TaxID=195482 RepID=A0ABQ8P9P2_9CRYT|nr:hypothetical protein OJ252_1973 [Cryptosporidium canis]KAJ1612479.1 hypothetical protein OIY81_1307 [Cryptosporidium canis]